MVTFTSWLAELAPRRLSFDWGRKLLFAIGSIYDVQADGAFYGIACRFPTVAPDDALPYLGRDRLLYQAPAESIEAYRARLEKAFVSWLWAGTAEGLRIQFTAMGIPDVVLLADCDWYHDQDQGINWSRFWSIIPAGHYTTIPSAADAECYQRFIELFRPAHVLCAGVTIILSGRLVGYPLNQTFTEVAATGLTFADSESYTF